MSTTANKHSANHNEKKPNGKHVRISTPSKLASEKPLTDEKVVATYKISAKVKEKAIYNCYMKRTNLAAQVEKFVMSLAESKQNVLD